MKHCYILLFALLVLGCKSGIDSRFPMEKRYWGPKEYDKVVYTIRYKTPEGERLPEFSNPETAPVIKKLIDQENFNVILNDEELGLQHRDDVAQEFFNEYRNLSKAYYLFDRRDKFIYGAELVEIWKFGLALQLPYFKLGNELIIKEADDPNSARIQKLLRSNENTIFKNYNNYLDFVNNESSFTEEQLVAFAHGIDECFPKLYETFPKGNKKINLNKARLMFEKAENPVLKNSLEQLIDLIEA